MLVGNSYLFFQRVKMDCPQADEFEVGRWLTLVTEIECRSQQKSSGILLSWETTTLLSKIEEFLL